MPRKNSGDEGSKRGMPRWLEVISWPFRKYREHNRRLPKIARFFEGLAIALFIALFLREMALQASWVPSTSMYPTLEKGDFLLVNRLVYLFNDPEPGDIIVFRHWTYDPQTLREVETDFIKRCVAVPGEYFRFQGGFLWKDSDADHAAARPYDESGYLRPAAIGKTYLPKPWDTNFRSGEPFEPGVWYRVPEDRYLMLGDNRTRSADSRYWGYLEKDKMKGKAFVIYMSFAGPEGEHDQMFLDLLDIPHYLTHLRLDRMMDTVK
jgi:signal peptidase I